MCNAMLIVSTFATSRLAPRTTLAVLPPCLKSFSFLHLATPRARGNTPASPLTVFRSYRYGHFFTPDRGWGEGYPSPHQSFPNLKGLTAVPNFSALKGRLKVAQGACPPKPVIGEGGLALGKRRASSAFRSAEGRCEVPIQSIGTQQHFLPISTIRL